MNRIYMFIVVLLALVIALSAPCLAGTGDPPSEEVRKAIGEALAAGEYPPPKVSDSDDARKAAKKALDSILKDNNHREIWLQEAGFESQEEIDKAELGEGFRIFELNLRKILADDTPYDPGGHVTIKGRNRWVFLIRVEGKVKTLLGINVYKNNIRDNEISISPLSIGVEGRTRLAKALDGLPALWPASAGYGYRIINDYEERRSAKEGKNMKELAAHVGLRYFIELSQNGKVLGFIPLVRENVTPGETRKIEIVTAGDLLNPDRFLTEIRAFSKELREWFEKEIEKQDKKAHPNGR